MQIIYLYDTISVYMNIANQIQQTIKILNNEATK
jgi:hypothetical protein